MAPLLTFLLPLLLGPGPAHAAPKEGALSFPSPEPLLLWNPLLPGEGSLRALQDYLKSVGQAEEEREEAGRPFTRERGLLLLLALHDGDGSGHLDGLEVMRLLSDLGGWQARGQPTLDTVERMVDHLLETEDRNGDGFLEPMEVLLGPRQAQPPRSPSGPSKSEEEAVEEGAMPRPEGPRPGGEGPGPPGGPGPRGSAPPDPELRGIEAPSPEPLPQQEEGGPGQERGPLGHRAPPNP